MYYYSVLSKKQLLLLSCKIFLVVLIQAKLQC